VRDLLLLLGGGARGKWRPHIHASSRKSRRRRGNSRRQSGQRRRHVMSWACSSTASPFESHPSVFVNVFCPYRSRRHAESRWSFLVFLPVQAMDHIPPKAHSMEAQDPQQPFGLDKQTATYTALSSQWTKSRLKHRLLPLPSPPTSTLWFDSLFDQGVLPSNPSNNSQTPNPHSVPNILIHPTISTPRWSASSK
jgi:hypothetical protein